MLQRRHCERCSRSTNARNSKVGLCHLPKERHRDLSFYIREFPYALPHDFELSPANDRRLFGESLVGAVSPWALNLLLEAYEERRIDAAAEFYDLIANAHNAGSLRG